MLDELSSDLPGMAPRHIRDIEPFLKPDKKASFNRNDYRSPIEEPDNDDDLDLPF